MRHGSDDLSSLHEVNRESIVAHQKRMKSANRTRQLSDFRQAHEITREQMAEQIGASLAEVIDLERGALDEVSVGTLRRYTEALGGSLELRAVLVEQTLELD
ncbi:XRE family transcriptional regulator [Glutamicibacter endophyticus]|uniref:XRE family transcriptional regulator n=1 Tax=Glutamicibacter endophyticus TaxID=1522174 RepID=UPI003AEF6C5D